jgi:haloacetate dehalogenase
MAGYGKSSKPPASSTRNHEEYSKRELANDLVRVMTQLNFEKFSMLAHDRGARVAHRLLLDHGDKVGKCVLLDIAPTLWMYEGTDMAFVRLSFFLTPSLPSRMAVLVPWIPPSNLLPSP